MHQPNVAAARRPTEQVEPAVKLTGVFELLVNEPRRASELLQCTGTEPAEQRRPSWRLLRRQLLAHDRAETLEVYTALDGYEAARDILAQRRCQRAALRTVGSGVPALRPPLVADCQCRVVVKLVSVGSV